MNERTKWVEKSMEYSLDDTTRLGMLSNALVAWQPIQLCGSVNRKERIQLQ